MERSLSATVSRYVYEMIGVACLVGCSVHERELSYLESGSRFDGGETNETTPGITVLGRDASAANTKQTSDTATVDSGGTVRSAAGGSMQIAAAGGSGGTQPTSADGNLSDAAAGGSGGAQTHAAGSDARATGTGGTTQAAAGIAPPPDSGGMQPAGLGGTTQGVAADAGGTGGVSLGGSTGSGGSTGRGGASGAPATAGSGAEGSGAGALGSGGTTAAATGEAGPPSPSTSGAHLLYSFSSESEAHDWDSYGDGFVTIGYSPSSERATGVLTITVSSPAPTVGTWLSDEIVGEFGASEGVLENKKLYCGVYLPPDCSFGNSTGLQITSNNSKGNWTHTLCTNPGWQKCEVASPPGGATKVGLDITYSPGANCVGKTILVDSCWYE